MFKFKHIIVLFLLIFGINHTVIAQFEIPEKPQFETSLYDYIDLLSASQKNELEKKLIRYADTTSTQIVVAIINSTEGENINFLGANWGQTWGIGGSKESDNGVFILLAYKDRKIAINTGYGVEHVLTDAMSKRIIERDIIPYFKQNDYYGGLNRGSEAIFEVLTGEYQGTRQSTNTEFPVGLIFVLFFIFIIIMISISKKNKGGGGNNRGHRSTGSDILEAIILSNMGRGSYRRGSSGWGGSSNNGSFGGGGGFGGSFGGGGFGGGGASGGW